MSPRDFPFKLNDQVVIHDTSMWASEIKKINGIKGIITRTADDKGSCIMTYRKGKRGKIHSIEINEKDLLYAPTMEKFNFEF